ncbi:dihydrofolate synthase, partial [Candidatus Woesearchaeota archaeon]
ILDGAQNKASALALKLAIQTIFNYKRLILVLGISRDKDIKGICSKLEKISDRIILTQATHPRAAPVAYLKRFISNGRIIHTRENLKDAIELALRKAKNEDLILVTGSLFTVGEARTIIKASKNE